MLESVESIVGSTIDYAPPVLLAALGGVLSERSGIANIALEGMMRFGAFFAAAVTLQTHSPLAGVCAGLAAGAVVGLIHAYLCVRWRSDQIVSGVALNLVALGGVTFLVEAMFGKPDTDPSETVRVIHIPALEQVPFLRALSGHSVLAYLALLLPFALHFFFYRTVAGLRVRAVGEKPIAAETAGLAVSRIRYLCVVCGGALAGMGGASLSISTLDHFNHHMPSGQGFMALAAVVFGKWTPLGAFGAATFFAGANALQISLSSSTSPIAQAIPSGAFAALPYILTLIVLAGFVKKTRPPGSVGIPYDPEAR
jgi:general nucleoside transport system permease protein